jgi:hypothetical protein
MLTIGGFLVFLLSEFFVARIALDLGIRGDLVLSQSLATSSDKSPLFIYLSEDIKARKAFVRGNLCRSFSKTRRSHLQFLTVFKRPIYLLWLLECL